MTGHSSSDDSWNAGARTESVRHLKVSFAGGFDTIFRRPHMCGSMFTEPGYYPVDILEFTPGRKIREDYTFTGGVSAVLGGAGRAACARGVRSAELCQAQGPASQEHAARLRILARRDVPCGPFAAGAVYIVGTNSENSKPRRSAHTRIVSGFRPRSGVRLAAALGEQRHAPHDQRRHGISVREYAGRACSRSTDWSLQPHIATGRAISRSAA